MNEKTPLNVALQEYGTRSIAGPASDPEVLKYFKDIGATWFKDDDTAWCAAFVNWCLKQAGYKYSANVNARSFIDYGIDSQNPELGDIVILWRDDIAGPLGHVGFLIREEYDTVYILGGNQQNTVNITNYQKARVLGYRKPVFTA